MYRFLKVGFYGMLVSFLGALPLGTLNLTAFDIAASEGLVAALWFAFAVILVELIMVRIALYGSEYLDISGRVTNYLLPLGVLLLLYLSISSFLSAQHTQELSSNSAFFPKISSAFVLGLLLSALNPLQIPFWLTWSKVLTAKGILKKSKGFYNFYLMGIGIGSFIGLAIFIFVGKYIFNNYSDYSFITSILMGVLYLGFAIYLLYVFIKRHLNLKTS